MTLLNELFIILTENDIQSELKKYKLKRYKNKVGKDIGGFVYFHKNYIKEFPLWEDNIINKSKLLPKDFKWNTLKYNTKLGNVTFINSPNFDTADEPISADNYTVDNDGNLKHYKFPNNPSIWHHKWIWVMDDYKGFNVEESKKRSIFWNKELEGYHDPKIRSKIGSAKIWNELEFNKGK